MGYRGKVVEGAGPGAAGRGPDARRHRRALGVAKSSVSQWVRDVEFEPDGRRGPARRRGPNALQRRKADEIDRLLAEGRERVGQLSEREFLVAGAALYAGEGAKTDGDVDVREQRPTDDRVLLRLAPPILPIDESRLRVRLYLHEGLDIEARRPSGRLTGIPPAQFTQPYRADADSTLRRPSTDGLSSRRLQLLAHASGRHGPRGRAAIVRSRYSGVAQSAEQSDC